MENSLRELKDFLKNIKSILRNLQDMIGGVLQALAKMNATVGLDHLTDRSASN